MYLIEVLTPDHKWIPMIPARQMGIPHNDVRIAPCVISLVMLLAKLGLTTPLKDMKHL